MSFFTVSLLYSSSVYIQVTPGVFISTAVVYTYIVVVLCFIVDVQNRRIIHHLDRRYKVHCCCCVRSIQVHRSSSSDSGPNFPYSVQLTSSKTDLWSTPFITKVLKLAVVLYHHSPTTLKQPHGSVVSFLPPPPHTAAQQLQAISRGPILNVHVCMYSRSSSRRTYICKHWTPNFVRPADSVWYLQLCSSTARIYHYTA